MVKTIQKAVCWTHLFRLLIWWWVMLYVLSRFLPCVAVDEYPLLDGIDNAWTQVLHIAFARHMQFGTDIVFTYGPWGFLARGYYPPTYLMATAAWAILSLVYLCAGWRLARYFSKNLLVAGLWLVAFTAAASLPVGDDFNNRLIAWSLLLLCLHFFVEEQGRFTPVQILLVVSLGWLSLVKFTGLLESLLVVVVIAGDNLLRQRRFPWIILVWLASLLFFWAAAGQHWQTLQPFLVNSWRITGGYTEAMMLTGKMEIRDAGIFLLLAGLLCGLIGWLAWRRQHGFPGLPLAGAGAVLFIVFKQGFVRSGWQHETTSALALVLVSLAVLAVARPAGKEMLLAASGLLLASALFAGTAFNSWLPGNGLGKQLSRTFCLDSLFAPAANPYTGYLKNNYEKTKAGVRKNFPLPPVNGNADIYSYNQNVLFAHNLQYQPRPVIQSYCAFTPGLAEMNAAHLRNPAAARNILFAVQTIDGRFPAQDDSLSWLELLTRYDLRGATDDKGTFLWLTRSAVPRQFHLLPLLNVSAHLGEPIIVPAATNGPVWVEIDLKKTLAGTLASTFYKPPELMLTVSLPHRIQHRYRIIPGMVRAGFLLSPIIVDNSGFAALATVGLPSPGALEVKSMTISAATESGTTICYEPSATIRFYRLDFPLQKSKIQWPLPAAKD